MTSSLIQLVSKTSRAICAVVTASFTRAAAGGVRQHANAKLADQRPEFFAGAAAAAFAPQRDGDDFRTRRLYRLGENRGRGILRGADDQARGEGDAVKVQRVGGEVPSACQPPCRGLTISMRSPSCRRVASRSALRTNVWFSAVAT